MPRRRRIRAYRLGRPLKTVKYSNETICSKFDLDFGSSAANDAKVILIPKIEAAGTRKAKNFTLSIEHFNYPFPVVFAVVFVPEGTVPSGLTIADPDTLSSLYEPNQNVIMTGIIPAIQNAPYTRRTRLARNLNNGDSIGIVLHPLAKESGQTARYSTAVTLNYAITF